MKWVNLTDEEPLDEEECIVFFPDRITYPVSTGFWDDSCKTFRNDSYESIQYSDVTHWMRLPNPPKIVD